MRLYERELVPHVKRFFEEKGYIVLTEQYVGRGRADLVAIKLDDDEIRKRIEHSVSHIPIKTLLKIIRLLDINEEMNIEAISYSLGYSPDYINKIVTTVNPLYLLKNNGKVKKIRDYQPFTKEVVSIEVKIGDWRNGLVQAYWYLDASNKTYLAIYNKNYHRIPSEVLAWAEERGVGILTVSKRGIVEEKIKSKLRGPKSRISHYILVESLWEKVLSISSQE